MAKTKSKNIYSRSQRVKPVMCTRHADVFVCRVVPSVVSVAVYGTTEGYQPIFLHYMDTFWRTLTGLSCTRTTHFFDPI